MDRSFRFELASDARFELRREIGEGGMGIVYEALDRESGAKVALKTLRQRDATSLYRFKQEFREAQDFHHPNLVALGDLIADDGQWYFTMELVDGVDFTSYVCEVSEGGTRGGAVDPHARTVKAAPPSLIGKPEPMSIRSIRAEAPFDEARLRAALIGLGQGLAALHARGKVHRDIKPSNVLVTRDGRVVLLDFGLLSDANALDPSNAIMGTLGYMAPEQAASQTIGPAADLYAVGAMLFEVLTGRTPFEGGPIDVLRKKLARAVPPSARSLSPRVPRDLDALCTELMSPDPAKRPSAEDLLARLGVKREATPRAVFVGRAQELASLWEAFEESTRGRATVTLVHGESGVGKSALVRELLARVDRDAPEAVVLAGRCYEREQAPYKGFDGVVDAIAHTLVSLGERDAAPFVPVDAAILARVFSVLRRVPLIDALADSPHQPIDEHESRKRAFRVLREILTRLASVRPVVLVIDDFQWADADSLALAREIVEPPDAPPLLLVLTSRDPSAGDLPIKVRRLHLHGLSEDESRALVSALRKERADGEAGVDSREIARETEGHPLFIQELVRHAVPSRDPNVPLRLDDAIGARIDALPRAARHLLECIAVAGAPLAQSTLAHAAEIDLATHATLIAKLRAEHLVRTSGGQGRDNAEPYHDRVRTAVLRAMDDDAQTRHHARLARVLEEEGGDKEARALVLHLEKAGQTLRAALFAERAADAASRALAFEGAAELYGVALRLGEHDVRAQRALQMKQAAALANAGHGIAAAEGYLEAAKQGDPALYAECMRRAAALLVGSGDLDRGMSAVVSALGGIGDALPSSPARAVASLLWHRGRLRLRGMGFRKTESMRVEPSAAERLETFNAVASTFSMIDPVCGAAYQARALHLALELGDASRIGRALALEATYLASQGGIARARTIAAEATRVAENTGDAYVIALARAATGIIAYYAGEYRTANEVLVEAEALLRDTTTGTAWELSTTRIFRLGALTTVGLFAELDRSVDEALRDAVRRDDRYTESSMVRMFNIVWLARDEPGEARRMLDTKRWTPKAGTFHIQHFFELTARIDIALYAGDAAHARPHLAASIVSLERSLMMRLQTARAMAHWSLARLAIAEGNFAAALVFARRLERERLAPAVVCASLIRASVATAERDDAAAMAHLDDAIARGDAADLLFWSAVARRRRGELLGGDEGRALVHEADVWLGGQGVRRPDRFAAIVTPPLR